MRQLKTRPRRAIQEPSSLGPHDWVAAARAALISGGIERVKVDVLARSLKISRGSFYWHFPHREALLAALLQDWQARNTAPFAAAVKRGDRNGRAEFQAIVDMWLEEKEYDPAYDAAVRDWARTSSRVAKLVRQVDRARIKLLAQIFTDLGFGREEADIRARITYFHQVGYYALGLQESKARRRKLAPVYARVLLQAARGEI
jgi:AcrR family transcriptional regulator